MRHEAILTAHTQSSSPGGFQYQAESPFQPPAPGVALGQPTIDTLVDIARVVSMMPRTHDFVRGRR